jgi:D-alanyl-D-alanine carboxypeptidase/D-alanyl-D-alanine-endopeptidase (penicillin-binding protein 4)
MADPALGQQIRASVIDAATGTPLYNNGATIATTPASTAKLATAAAVLAVHASSDRITTTVTTGPAAGQVVLVGAGDPTLSGAAAGQPTGYSGAARISDLVAQLRAAHVTVTKIIVDGRLFTGPSTAPGWLPGDTPTDYASPITALMADGGRATPTAFVRSGTPDLAAGQALAAQLGLPATAVSRGNAPAGAKILAKVESAPYGQLVQQMLQISDNVIAECLARQVAISEHQPASFAGAVIAVRRVLAARGVNLGAAMTDGSGLAGTDRLAPAVLVALLRLAATWPIGTGPWPAGSPPTIRPRTGAPVWSGPRPAR